MESRDCFDRVTRARSFMLERDNMPRTADNLSLMRQRLFGEGSWVVAYETGEFVRMTESDIDIGIANAALYLEEVLASNNYSHLTKIPICMSLRIEIWWTEQLELAEALQESMDNADFGAIPATREAIDLLEKTRPDKSPSEGDMAEPCSICLEEMNALDVEVARMPCRHVFHYDCISRWLSTSHMCPLCRFPMPTDPVSQQQTMRFD
ncbi:RING-H2 finger protein ATL22-like [Rhodamnia argentea]|uniref:RING-type E3 ubiquitin transferase n=1 Tax=Rhodamnia argentea TaxID=178133 RepID=A0ABM3GYR3_9MYRT|nr:RING-H2 finger protein ATL22-like [Rhodamnia argentea]